MFDPSNEPAVPTDLPGIYDTFDEARRASFVNAMNYKQNGGKLCEGAAALPFGFTMAVRHGALVRRNAAERIKIWKSLIARAWRARCLW